PVGKDCTQHSPAPQIGRFLRAPPSNRFQVSAPRVSFTSSTPAYRLGRAAGMLLATSDYPQTRPAPGATLAPEVPSGSNPVLGGLPLYVRLGAASGIPSGTARRRSVP